MRSRDDGMSILGPFLQRLAQCVAQAWEDLNTIPAGLRVDMSPRTRAAFVNDRVKIHARTEFQTDPRVAFVRGRGGLFVLGICNAFLLRFKKLKPNLRSSNIHTTQAFLFSMQRELELPNTTPALTHVNAGYILNRMQTQIAATYVTCPVGKRIEWFIDLAKVSFGDVVQMPPRAKQAKTRTKVVPKVPLAPPQRTEKSTGGEDGDDDDTNRKR